MPGAARHRGGAPPPRPPGPAHADRARRRDRRGARGAPFLRARGLRRRGDQPLPRVRDARGDPRRQGCPTSTRSRSSKNYIKAVGKGIMKVMSKMGISTYQSYCGAQIFDAVGLVERVRRQVLHRHRDHDRGHRPRPKSPRRRCAATPPPTATTRSTATMLDVGGIYQYRLRGEDHAWTPANVANLQHAVRGNILDELRGVRRVDQRAVRAAADDPRADGAEAGRPAARRSTRSSRPSEIVKRFATGAMSFGSISREAHTTLAIAMNRIGGRSNTGEGGEEADRFVPLPNGDSMRSRDQAGRLAAGSA